MDVDMVPTPTGISGKPGLSPVQPGGRDLALNLGHVGPKPGNKREFEEKSNYYDLLQSSVLTCGHL